MMQYDDNRVTCPYAGDLLFCLSQACLKNYKFNKNMKKKIIDQKMFDQVKQYLEVGVKVQQIKQLTNLSAVSIYAIGRFDTLEDYKQYNRDRLAKSKTKKKLVVLDETPRQVENPLTKTDALWAIAKNLEQLTKVLSSALNRDTEVKINNPLKGLFK